MSNQQFTILIDGKNYTGFETVRVESSFLQGSSSAHIMLPPKNFGTPYPIKANAPIQIFLHGKSVINGYIDGLRPAMGMSGNIIMATVRDKIGDLIDSTIDPKGIVKYTGNITLEKVVIDYLEKLYSYFLQNFHII